MTYCENINNPQYRINLANLTKILGDSNAAIAALELNNGFSLDKAPNGNDSYLYQSLYNRINEKYPDLLESQKIKKAIQLKLQTYSEEFKNWFRDWQNNPEHPSKVVDENGEPLITLIDIYQKNLDLTDQDTKDILALIRYQGEKDGLDESVIKLQQVAYLRQESWMVNQVKSLIDKIAIRQAQLHILEYDFNDEIYTEDGLFDWNYYLGGINLYDEIERPEIDFESKFSPLIDYKVDLAEIIMPKLYKSNFNLGNRNINEITVDYFKKANSFYQSDLKQIKHGTLQSTGNIDFLIRCHSYKFNIAVQDKLSEAPGRNLTAIDSKSIQIEDGYRLNESGEKMYILPEDTSIWQIYRDSQGNETLVFKSDSNYSKDIRNLISSLDNSQLVSIEGFFDNITPTDDWIEFIIQHNHIKTHNRSLRQCLGQNPETIKEKLYEIYLDYNLIKNYKSDLSNTLYNSFVRTLNMISVRIPTQAFQSIMAAKVVALTNDTDNNVFVNRWQFWLQGSDMDIDKSYLMGSDISRIGFYNHWSPLADFTTEDLSKISDTLPVPNQKQLVLLKEAYKNKGKYLIYIQSENIDPQLNNLVEDWLNIDSNLDTIAQKYNIYPREKQKETIRLTIESALLQYLTRHDSFNISDTCIEHPNFKYLIKKLNKHNSHIVTADEARNIIQRHIIRTSADERNMKASYSPIDVAMDYFKTALNKIEDQKSLQRDLDDGGLSIARMQYTNAVGKKDVGIMANGLKAFFALTQYLNKQRKNPNFVKSNAYFLTKLNITGKDNYISTISDIQFEREAIKTLTQALQNYLPENSNDILKFVDHDASLLISSLVSLATDNAKELALAKMNASIDLACIHLFLIVMGYTGEEVVNFTANNPDFQELSSLMNSSKISGEKTLNVRDALHQLQNKYKQNPIKLSNFIQLEYIYNCAQEMSTIAKICAINQGTKVDEIESDRFYKNFENVIKDQIAIICPSGEYGNPVLFDPNTWNFTVDNISNLSIDKHNIISDKLTSKLVLELERLNKINSENHYMNNSFKINLQRYFEDDNYRQFCVDFYNIFKYNFNVLDCINNLPHFYEMLHAFTIAETIIKEFNSRSRTILDYSADAYLDNVYNRAKIETSFDGEISSKSKIVFDKISYGDSIKNQAGRFYDDYIMSEFLNESGQNYNFSYRGADNKIYEINLQTNKGIADFCNFMAYILIPTLQQEVPTNTFLTYIRPDFRKLRKGTIERFLPGYRFNFDIDSLVSISDQNKAFYVQKGFADLMTNESGQPLTLNTLGFDMISNGNLPITELIYLYDKLVNLGGSNQNSLDRAFELYLSKSLRSGNNTIAKQLAQIIQEHDRRIRPDVKLDPVLFTAYCYKNQVLRKQKGIFRYNVQWNPKSKTWEENKAPFLDINGKYLFNLQTVNEINNFQKDSEIFIELLQKNIISITKDESTYTLKSQFDQEFNFDGSNDDLSLEILLHDLYHLKSNNSKLFETFKQFIKTVNENYIENVPKLQSWESVSVYKKFADRMKQLGVQVNIINDLNAPNGFLQDGMITLNETSDITTTPIHELMHMVLQVMKTDNYNVFERLMNITFNNLKEMQNIYQSVNKSEVYGNLMENDKKEEAFCRFLEAWIQDNSIIENLNTPGIDLATEIQQILNPFIGKTFGIIPPTSLLEFLEDTISDLPKYGSTLFVKMKSDSTGYLNQKTKVIQSVKITAFIEDLIKKEQLKETEC